jgi:hypothetical protein
MFYHCIYFKYIIIIFTVVQRQWYTTETEWCSTNKSSLQRLRVHLTGGNRPGYRGYRPAPVSVPTGYQPVDFKHLGFEFEKLKNEEKYLKILHDLLSLMVSNFLQTSFV